MSALTDHLDRAHRMSCSDPDDPSRTTTYSEASAEIKRLEALVLDIDSMLTERSVTLDGTWNRMLEEGMKPKSQRDPDHDFEDTVRYGHYAAQARVIMELVRNKIRASA